MHNFLDISKSFMGWKTKWQVKIPTAIPAVEEFLRIFTTSGKRKIQLSLGFLLATSTV